MRGRRLHVPGNIDDLARQLEKILQEIPQETVRVLYHSMPRLVAACIRARGGSTPYCARYFVTNDEAHFWLNGYVNKQNCRIWSEANPQVYVETPLDSEKLTVWCALWAGGILLQKR
ncbi:hypothetical protein TNCV_4661161 [Trichonephila clavipes]|uniref:Uncharacterized protein n=1 Tax=Trichonephila clavipes TaxID=2585209 RepID=A0A8X6S8P3_TRICX|nr:hypothetical protein TNCV_4661161 [Trichonephila clavipes]